MRRGIQRKIVWRAPWIILLQLYPTRRRCSRWVRRGAERTYPENVLPFEAEAMWAMYVEHKSLDALEVCAGLERCGSTTHHPSYPRMVGRRGLYKK